MKLKRLQTKITIWAGVCLIVTAILIIGYAAWTMIAKAEQNRQAAIKIAESYAVSVARQYASRAKVEFETALDTARTLADILSGIKRQGNGLELDRDEVNGMLRNLLEQNAQFVGIYTGWESNAFDAMDLGYANEAGHDATGRFIPYWSRTQDGVIQVEPLLDYDKDGPGDYYLLPKRTKQECLIDPYLYSVQGTPTLMTSLVVPILANDTFYGIVGIDLKLELFQPIVEDQKTIYDGTADILIVSHKGIVVAASHQAKMVGKPLQERTETDGDEDLPEIQMGQELIEIEDGRLEITTPLTIGKASTPWGVKVFIPLEKITATADAQRTHAFLDIWRMCGLSVACMLIALGLLWAVARTITLPIGQVVAVAERLSEGQLNLEIDVKSSDEIGQLQRAMKLMIEQLRGFALSVKKAAEQVADGSQAINATAAQMSHGAATQAAAAEEVSASMEEMAANIRQNADNAMQTEQIAMQASADARDSGFAVNEAVTAMQEIAKKIAMIEDITRQTRMLSLNATIEAARAHEQGRGFAVVASEVRALSERSQSAANEITELTGSSVAVADRAGNMLRKLVPAIQKTAELVQEISAASKEQDAGTGQINRAIQQLDHVTQQNAATSEEMAAMAEELAAQSEQLQTIIAFFKIDTIQSEKKPLASEISTPPASSDHARSAETSSETPSINRVKNEVYAPVRDDHDDDFERF